MAERPAGMSIPPPSPEPTPRPPGTPLPAPRPGVPLPPAPSLFGYHGQTTGGQSFNPTPAPGWGDGVYGSMHNPFGMQNQNQNPYVGATFVPPPAQQANPWDTIPMVGANMTSFPMGTQQGREIIRQEGEQRQRPFSWAEGFVPGTNRIPSAVQEYLDDSEIKAEAQRLRVVEKTLTLENQQLKNDNSLLDAKLKAEKIISYQYLSDLEACQEHGRTKEAKIQELITKVAQLEAEIDQKGKQLRSRDTRIGQLLGEIENAKKKGEDKGKAPEGPNPPAGPPGGGNPGGGGGPSGPAGPSNPGGSYPNPSGPPGGGGGPPNPGPANPVTHVAPGLQKPGKLNKPEPFDGQRKNYRAFMNQCEQYLRVNLYFYPDENSQVEFIISYMTKGAAANWVDAYNKQRKTGFMTIRHMRLEQFLACLERDFAPTQQADTALHKLKTSQQGKHSVEEHVIYWRSTLATAGITLPSEEVKQQQGQPNPYEKALTDDFVRSLRSSIVMEIMKKDRRQRPVWLDEWMTEAIEAERDRRFIAGMFGQGQQQQQQGQKKSSSTSSSVPKAKDENAMDVDGVDIAATYTDEEKAARIRTGKCFRCGRGGHIIKNCTARKHVDGTDLPTKGSRPSGVQARVVEVPPQESSNERSSMQSPPPVASSSNSGF